MVIFAAKAVVLGEVIRYPAKRLAETSEVLTLTSNRLIQSSLISGMRVSIFAGKSKYSFP